jgi:hypothetical protein
MMFPVSAPVWALLPILQRVQFPWRFGVLLSLSAAAVIASTDFALFSGELMRSRRARCIQWLLVWPVLVIAVGAGMRTAIQAAGGQIELESDYTSFEDRPEYRPNAVDAGLHLDRLKDLQRARIVRGAGSVAVRNWRSRDVRLVVDAKTDVTVEVKQFALRDWAATAGSEHLAITAGREGLIRFRVGHGRHSVSLRLTRSAPERIGLVLTVASLAVVTALFLARTVRFA